MIRLLAFAVIVLAIFVIYKGSLLLLNHEHNLGFKRLAQTVSGLWLGVPLALMLAKTGWDFAAIDQEAWIAWVLLALIPNVLFWALLWVMRGFRRS